VLYAIDNQLQKIKVPKIAADIINIFTFKENITAIKTL